MATLGYVRVNHVNISPPSVKVLENAQQPQISKVSPEFPADYSVSNGSNETKPKQNVSKKNGVWEWLTQWLGIEKKYDPITHDEMSEFLHLDKLARFDGKGNYLYNPSQMDSIIEHFGENRVEVCDWKILRLLVEGHKDPMLIFPETMPSSSENGAQKTFLDYSSLLAPDVIEAKRPIVFYLPKADDGVAVGEAQFQQCGSVLWVQSLRDLGYNVVLTDSKDSFINAVNNLNPYIALISSAQDLKALAWSACKAAKEINPNLIVGLGGRGALQEDAMAFDFVATGEYYMGLPRILHELLLIINRKEIGQVEGIQWSEIIAEWNVSDDEKKAALKIFGQESYYPPVFEEGIARDLIAIGARRFINDDEGCHELNFPIGHDPIEGARLFIRSDAGIIAPSCATSPKRDRHYKYLRPLLMTPDEFDAISGARFPSRRDLNPNFPLKYPSLYAQHGCRINPQDDRCMYCSIIEPFGKRAVSPEQVIRIMQTAVLNGMEYFIFTDDRFIQDKVWLQRLADLIAHHGLKERIRILIQTRADGISKETMDLVREEMGAAFLLGLETMLPHKAERIGKVARGKGEQYIKDFRKTLDMLASNPKVGDAFYIIPAMVGDTIIDIADDICEQLRLIDKIWRKTGGGYLPKFSYSNIRQLPYIGDRITSGMTGYERGQPGLMSIQDGAARVTLGDIKGNFVSYAPVLTESTIMVAGVFVPREFSFPPAVAEFIRNATPSPAGISGGLLGKKRPTTVGDLVVAIRAVYEIGNLSDDEKKLLKPRLAEIERLYKKLADEIGEGVMSESDSNKLDENRRLKYGGSPNSTIC